MRPSKTSVVEIVGLLPCTVILGKLLLVGLFGMVFVLGMWALGPAHSAGNGRVELGGTALFLLLMVSGLAGLAGVWAGVLLGAERLRRRAWQRWGALVCLLLGLGAAGYWLLWMARQAPGVLPASPWGWAFWSLLLVPPVAVGARQIYLLLQP